MYIYIYRYIHIYIYSLMLDYNIICEPINVNRVYNN